MHTAAWRCAFGPVGCRMKGGGVALPFPTFPIDNARARPQHPAERLQLETRMKANRFHTSMFGSGHRDGPDATTDWRAGSSLAQAGCAPMGESATGSADRDSDGGLKCEQVGAAVPGSIRAPSAAFLHFGGHVRLTT